MTNEDILGPNVWDFYMLGGVNYSHGEPEQFASISEAVAAWRDREASNGLRRCEVRGEYLLFPGWGEGLSDDDYVITTPSGDGWSYSEVMHEDL